MLVEMSHETRVVAMRYDDLNINRDAGMRALYVRLNTAVKRVCGTYDIRNLRDRHDWQQYYDSALSHALAQVDDERMTQRVAAYDGRATNAPRIGTLVSNGAIRVHRAPPQSVRQSPPRRRSVRSARAAHRRPP
jgi:UrcA family protein